MECPICLLDLERDKVTMDCCKQEIHLKCLVRWLDEQRNCPMCRAEHQGIQSIQVNEIIIVRSMKRHFFQNTAIMMSVMALLAGSLLGQSGCW